MTAQSAWVSRLGGSGLVHGLAASPLWNSGLACWTGAPLHGYSPPRHDSFCWPSAKRDHQFAYTRTGARAGRNAHSRSFLRCISPAGPELAIWTTASGAKSFGRQESERSYLLLMAAVARLVRVGPCSFRVKSLARGLHLVQLGIVLYGREHCCDLDADVCISLGRFQESRVHVLRKRQVSFEVLVPDALIYLIRGLGLM